MKFRLLKSETLNLFRFKATVSILCLRFCHSSWNSECVSLLKSKSGFLIQKRIYRFFTKIENRIVDSNDPQRRWILWIISKTGYFGYMIRNVSLLRIRKEWIQPAVNRNKFNTYSSCLTTLLIFTAIFELEAWIKRSILSVFSLR